MMPAMTVKGFRGAAVEAEIKYKGRTDLGIIFSSKPACAAAVFTKNDVKAAPVINAMKKMKRNRNGITGILVNSGNANACTGENGLEAAEATAGIAAEFTGCNPDSILVASTGVIGVPLPVERFNKAMPDLVSALSETGLVDVADAILTTDTVRKTAGRTFNAGGMEISIAGMAKGAGMIGPDMCPPSATMLAFILTDAPVETDWWQAALSTAVNASFNSIIVDGDTSTNDMVIALANGAANHDNILSGTEKTEIKESVSNALAEISMELARQIVLDGEGATKCVDVTVSGAAKHGDAVKAARIIASSPLVKTAFFGEDPNWGRILAAAGRAGISMKPDQADLYIGDILIASKGVGTGEAREKQAAKTMKNRAFSIRLELNMGDCSATVVTTDLSDEYVRINADYRT